MSAGWPKAVWNVRQTEHREAAALARAAGVPTVVGQLLLQRGVGTPRAARAFLNPSPSQLFDPFLLTGMRAAVDRVTLAATAGRRRWSSATTTWTASPPRPAHAGAGAVRPVRCDGRNARPPARRLRDHARPCGAGARRGRRPDHHRGQRHLRVRRPPNGRATWGSASSSHGPPQFRRRASARGRGHQSAARSRRAPRGRPLRRGGGLQAGLRAQRHPQRSGHGGLWARCRT